METTQMAARVKVGTLPNSNDPNLPFLVEADSDNSLATITSWLEVNHDMVQQKLTEHGAILMRGFQVNNEEDFQEVALGVEKDLKNDYQGTSPRNQRTQYVFNASELPDYYPIMQHCEMSFLPSAPRRLFFFCKTAPEGGGETPIVDFRKVWAQMDPTIRADFEKKGIRHIRNYSGPNDKSLLKLWELKAWPEIFNTTDKAEVSKKCEETNQPYEWNGDKLRLLNEKEAYQDHPETGERVWYNHLQVFHRDAAKIEYQHIKKERPNFRNRMVSMILSFMTVLKHMTVDPMDESMHTTFRDGSPIPLGHVEHVQDLIWKNMVAFKWQKGDVIALDNFSTSHGRLPYKGPREILVSWSS